MFEVVSENVYRVDPEGLHRVRCIEGNYESDYRLPAITYPGGDAGVLGLIYASGQAYGFEIDHSKAFTILLAISGGIDLFSCCQAPEQSDTSLYLPFAPDVSFDEDDIQAFLHQMEHVCDHSTEVHQTDHRLRESAIIKVKGDYGIFPQSELRDEQRRIPVSVYIYQQTLMDRHLRVIARELYEQNAVELYSGCDDEYLYEVMSEMADTLLYSSLQNEFKQIPIFTVAVDDDLQIDVTEV